MGNFFTQTKVQPLTVDTKESNISKVFENGKRRKFLTDPHFSDEKYDNAKILADWIVNSDCKEFFMMFKINNGKTIYLIRENSNCLDRPTRNNKLTLMTPMSPAEPVLQSKITEIDTKFEFHISQAYHYIYDFCLHKITNIICYKNRNLKERIWSINYDENKIIVIPNNKVIIQP